MGMLYGLKSVSLLATMPLAARTGLRESGEAAVDAWDLS